MPYNNAFWDEMDHVASEYRVLYAEKNKNAFVASLHEIELNDDEINSLLCSELFVSQEKKQILSKWNVTMIGKETTGIIKELNFRIP